MLAVVYVCTLNVHVCVSTNAFLQCFSCCCC